MIIIGIDVDVYYASDVIVCRIKQCHVVALKSIAQSDTVLSVEHRLVWSMTVCVFMGGPCACKLVNR